MKIETNDCQLKDIIQLADMLEDPAIQFTSNELQKHISDLHYKTRRFLRPELGEVKNENK